MTLPSKELMSEVLKRDVDKVKSIEGNTIIYGCVPSDGWYDEINIYEFAHKCKEWAMRLEKEPYIIESSYEHFTHDGIMYAICRVYHDGDMVWNNYGNEFIGEWHTEPGSIFKACEWVMNNA